MVSFLATRFVESALKRNLAGDEYCAKVIERLK